MHLDIGQAGPRELTARNTIYRKIVLRNYQQKKKEKKFANFVAVVGRGTHLAACCVTVRACVCMHLSDSNINTSESAKEEEEETSAPTR